MSNSTSFISQSNKSAFRNPWVIGWLAGLILVVAINAGFIITAFYTSPGLVDQNYYEKGQDHEQNVQKKLDNRARLAWDFKVDLPKKLFQGKVANLYVDIFDKKGARLAAEKMTLNVYRPSNVEQDFTNEMTELAPGRFLTSLDFKYPGVWELNLVAKSGEDTLDVTYRIFVEKSQ